MKVKCPWCGAVGTDVAPIPEHLRGPSYEPPKGYYAFEVRGNYGGRPVRKCLNCGNGVRLTILPPRFRKVPPDEWADLQRRWEQYKTQQDEEMRGLFGRSAVSGDTPPTAHSDKVLEGIRLAAAYDVDLVDLADSIIAQVSEAHARSTSGRVWFPAEAIRGLCCIEFLVAAEVSDPRLDEAYMRSALSSSEEATTKVSESSQRVIEERGLTPVIDALLELIRDDSAPPASELL